MTDARSAPPETKQVPSRIKAVLRMRCPHCLQGAVFDGLISMRETCPVCGITYEREHGFFMTAIFFGYVLGFVALLPAIVLLLLIDATIIWYVIVPTGILVVLAPLLLRYSRVLWMHADELLDPRDSDEVPGAAKTGGDQGGTD